MYSSLRFLKSLIHPNMPPLGAGVCRWIPKWSRYVLGAYTLRKDLRKIINAVTKAAARIAVGASTDKKDDKLFGASLASPVCPPCYDAIKL